MLEIDHFFVFSGFLIEFSMIPTCHDTSLIEEIDRISAHDGREAMRDDDTGTTSHEVVERFLYESLSLRIESTGGFIEDEDLWIGEDSSGDRYTLLLTSGELQSSFSDLGLPSSRKRLYKLQNICFCTCFFELFFCDTIPHIF